MRRAAVAVAGCVGVVLLIAATDRVADTRALVDTLTGAHHYSADQQTRVTELVLASDRMGTGNGITQHPMTKEECRARQAAAGVTWDNPAWEKICGGPYMAPLYDPTKEKPEDAKLCIDQLEFPDVPCEYPVIWVRAQEAEQMCRAVGKRLCDAHEWEGACAGQLLPPDYDWDLAAGKSDVSAVSAMRAAHNGRYKDPSTHTWSFGPEYKTGICAQASEKSPGCDGSDWRQCGSNTYPTGAFPDCKSPLGVYDINGNAAEHMNLPLAPDQMASAGTKLGVTEMKGSWFIFDRYHAHEDWCRWRAPFWHGTRVMIDDSHRNYHLGFRCCRDVGAR